MNKVALYGRQFSEDLTEHIQLLVDELQKQNFKISVFKPFFTLIRHHIKFNSDPEIFSNNLDLDKNTTLLISVGGDGTLLDTITIIRDSGIPVLGINLGKLGFLSSVSKNEIAQAIYDIRNSDFQIENRTLLRLETGNYLFNELNFALNEVTIMKGDQRSLVTVHVWVDNQYLNSYWSDGLIIATPTGSTAYSLSCSGPIIVPAAPNFVITPIATHNLTVRPIVIPDSTKIKIKVEGRCDKFVVSLDSRSSFVDKETELLILKENFTLNLVKLTNKDFFSTIREKLLWGHDKRN